MLSVLLLTGVVLLLVLLLGTVSAIVLPWVRSGVRREVMASGGSPRYALRGARALPWCSRAHGRITSRCMRALWVNRKQCAKMQLRSGGFGEYGIRRRIQMRSGSEEEY